MHGIIVYFFYLSSFHSYTKREFILFYFFKFIFSLVSLVVIHLHNKKKVSMKRELSGQFSFALCSQIALVCIFMFLFVFMCLHSNTCIDIFFLFSIRCSAAHNVNERDNNIYTMFVQAIFNNSSIAVYLTAPYKIQLPNVIIGSK